MIFLYTLKRYTKGIRLFSAVLVVMMFVSLWMTVKCVAKYYYDISDMLVFQSADPTNAYYMQIFPDSASFAEDLDLKAAQNAITALKKNPKVEKAFGIKYAGSFSYKDSGFSIAIYDPQMLELFPGLKRMGINFSKNPEGVILGSSAFADLGIANEVEVAYSLWEGPWTTTLPVAGRISAPYRIIRFGSASTNMTASGLFNDGDIVIMLDKEENIERFDKNFLQMYYDPNFVVVFRDDVSVEEQHTILAEAAPHHVWESFDEITENTNKSIGATLKEELPQPFFYMLVSVVAYISCVILTLKKKQRELAVYRLLGYSQRKAGLFAFSAVTLTAVIPVTLCTILILILQNVNLSLNRLTSLLSAKRIEKDLYHFLLSYSDCRFGPVCLVVVLIYYAITVAIALGITVGTMRKNSPLTYLRGASQ